MSIASTGNTLERNMVEKLNSNYIDFQQTENQINQLKK